MKKNIWVLHTCNRLSIGGVQSFLMNFYRNIDKTKIQFAFAVQRDEELPYDKEIISMGGRIHYMPRISDNFIKYLRALYSLIKNHPEYKICHSHMNQRNALSLLVAKILKVPVRISHAHNKYGYMSLFQKFRYLILKKIISIVANNFWACSISANNCLHYKNKKYLLINNAIDINKFSFNSEIRQKKRAFYNIGTNDIVIGNISNFSYQKNIEYLLSIIDILPLNYKLMLVGDGTNCKKIITNTLTIKNRKKIIFTGVAKSNEMYQAMDIFAFPSYYEGLGIVAIEAIAAGLPVIASTGVPNDIDIVNRLKERVVLLDSVCHLPIRKKDVNKWCEKINEYSHLSRINNYEILTKAGYNIFEKINFVTDKYIQILNNNEECSK